MLINSHAGIRLYEDRDIFEKDAFKPCACVDFAFLQ